MMLALQFQLTGNNWLTKIQYSTLVEFLHCQFIWNIFAKIMRLFMFRVLTSIA